MNVNISLNGLYAARDRMLVSTTNVANVGVEGAGTLKVNQSAGRSGPVVNVEKLDRPPELVEEVVEFKKAVYDFKSNAVFLREQNRTAGMLLDILA